MTDSVLARSLLRYADSSHANEAYRAPFTLVVDDSPWAVAVSGPSVVAVKGKASYPVRSLEDVECLLRRPSDRPQEVTLGDLRAWCHGDGPKEGVVFGLVFDRNYLGELISCVPFTSLQISTGFYQSVPYVVVEAVGKWRAILAGLDVLPTPAMPVFGAYKPSVERELFDLALNMD